MTIGLTVSTAVFQKVLKDSLWLAFENETGSGVLIEDLRNNLDAVQSLDPRSKHLAQVSYMKALHVVFWIAMAESIVAAIASLCMKENKIPESLRE